MENSTKLTVAFALMLATTIIAAASINANSPAEAGALPFAVTPAGETPVCATKGDRFDTNPGIRQIAGVTLVLRDFGRAVR
jgi:hypothetical protein